VEHPRGNTPRCRPCFTTNPSCLCGVGFLHSWPGPLGLSISFCFFVAPVSASASPHLPFVWQHLPMSIIFGSGAADAMTSRKLSDSTRGELCCRAPKVVPVPVRVPMFWLCVASLLAAATSDTLRQIPFIECTRGRTTELVVAEHRVEIDGVASFSTRAYFYRGIPMLPGPILVMRPNNTCKILLRNGLSPAGNAACAAHTGESMNMYHCPDVINLHTHGTKVVRTCNPE
jgi:hypothetical protein